MVVVGRLDRDLWWNSSAKSEPGRLPNVSKFVSQLTVFSLPIALYDLLAMAAMRLDLFLLAPHVTAQELGIYGAAAQTAFLVKKIRQSFEPIYAPVLADQLRSEDTQTLRYSLQNMTLWITAFSFGFLLLVALVGKEILLIFGPEFGRGSTVLLLLSWAYAINGFWGVTENVVLLKKPYWNLCNWMVSICLGAMLCLVLIPSYRLTGAALAIATAFTVLNLLRLWQTYRLVKIHPLNSDSGSVVFSAVTLGICASFLLQAGPETVLFRLTVALLTVVLYGGVVFGIFKRR
jgi:O-antigen/teichoic acid export membrane protein